jgi:hypothetical protein
MLFMLTQMTQAHQVGTRLVPGWYPVGTPGWYPMTQMTQAHQVTNLLAANP